MIDRGVLEKLGKACQERCEGKQKTLVLAKINQILVDNYATPE